MTATLTEGVGETHRELRLEVREFLVSQRDAGRFQTGCNTWSTDWSPELSREVGARGWIGLPWPTRYGGGGRTSSERLAVVEEFLAAGAPVAAHWVAERQIGPLLLHGDSEELRERFLPPITRGEVYFAVGMSEPQAGSDLAAIRTRAEKVPGGWELHGRKIWTSHAHLCHYAIVLVRTSPVGEDRKRGMTQFLVDLSAPGVHLSGITVAGGRRHFNEVTFEGAFVPDELVVGGVGEGWDNVIAELALERSGPERYLSSFPLLARAATLAAGGDDRASRAEIGSSLARIAALRRLTRSVAASVDAGGRPELEAAKTKEVGARIDQDVVEIVRPLLDDGAPGADDADLRRLYEQAAMWSPAYTLRGGTTEILRGMIARGMGLR